MPKKGETTCPYSRSRLEEMYWKEGMCARDIAAHCRNATGVTTCIETVLNWLRRFGIPIRTNSHAIKVAYRVKPELLEKARVNIAVACKKAAEVQKGRPPSNPDWGKSMKKGKVASARKRAEEGWETRVCAHCGKDVRRRKSHFQNPPERTHCSRSCAMKARVERARKAKAEEALTRQIVNLVGYDPRDKTEGE